MLFLKPSCTDKSALLPITASIAFFPRTAVHWNALPISIVMLPTVAQFSHAVCQVVHVSPESPDSVFSSSEPKAHKVSL